MNDRLPYDSFVIAPEAALPYSKGVMAKMLMVTGIPPTRAYSLAQQIEGRLVAGRTTVATGEGLFDLAADVLRRHEGESAMLRLRRYKALHDLDLPVIVLVGGSTGAGKSAVATEVAHRLGITRLTSTDFLRQAMRAFFAPEVVPSIHLSSFEAGDAVSVEFQIDRTVEGFVDQARHVLVGVRALLERAVSERLSMVLEGVHLVPGMLPREIHGALVVQCALAINDAEAHASHFWIRDTDSEGVRPYEKYLDAFDDIRLVQAYIQGRARKHDVPVIENGNIEDAIGEVMELVLSATEPLEVRP